MSIPRYRTGERVRVIVEGPIVDVLASGVELTVALETPNASYEVTVPTSHVTIERLAPAGGEPQPGQLWADATGEERYAYRSSKNGVSLFDERGVGVPWQIIHTDPRLGPITRVRPLPDAAAPQPEADPPREPRLMLGDLWEDGDDEVWRVAAMGGELRLALGHSGYPGYPCTWGEVDGEHGPLTLVQRAGYRPTGGTVPAERLTIGMVVSHPDWVGGAPVRLTAPADGTERAYELFGDGETGVSTAAPGALFTVWEPVGGAR